MYTLLFIFIFNSMFYVYVYAVREWSFFMTERCRFAFTKYLFQTTSNFRN